MIARIAGLAATTLDAFHCEHFPALFADRRELESRLLRSRREMVDLLHGEIPGKPKPLRRLLLAVKRDCFNDRPIARHRDAEGWEELRGLGGPLLDRILRLEDRLAEIDAEAAARFRQERTRQRRHLASFLDDPGLQRGLALASRELVANAGRFRNAGSGRKARKLELSLLRYVSRATVKPSPFSSLGRIGLGAVVEDLPPGAPVLLGSDWRQRSLVRFKPYQIEQIRDLVLTVPAVRAALRVELNPTLRCDGDTVRCFRPGFWSLDRERRQFAFVKDAMVEIRLPEPLTARLREALADGPRTYAALTSPSGDEARDGDGAGFAGIVDRLLELGCLRFALPWPVNTPRLEQSLLDYLDSLPPDPRLQTLIDTLRTMTELEDRFATSDRPARVLADLEKVLGDLRTAASRLADVPPVEAGDERRRVYELYEDVLLLPAKAGAEAPEILRLSAPTARRIAEAVDPLERLAHLFSPHHELLYAISALMKERWPDRRQVELLEVFRAAQPLWRDYSRHLMARRDDLDKLFNPFELAPVEALGRFRAEVWSERERWTERRDGELRISREVLGRMLDGAPPHQPSSVRSCLFVQPADSRGERWVVNQMNEGTGRWSSRFTPVLGRQARFLSDSFAAASRLEDDGGPVELLDLMCVQGDTLNVHQPMTHRVLETHGRVSDLPAHRRLGLSDLQVARDEESGLPRIVDGHGRRYLPVHVGSANHVFMPVIVRFLSQFGLGERLTIYPSRTPRDEGQVRIFDRLAIDDLILMRKRWRAPADLLRGLIEGASPAAAFSAVNRWRIEHDIPEKVLVMERVGRHAVGVHYKPQYVDFTSPVFFGVFVSALENSGDSFDFEEMLPQPEAMLLDAEARPWAIELQLETSVLPRTAEGIRREAPPPAGNSKVLAPWSTAAEPEVTRRE